MCSLRFSVVITSYNYERFLGSCIQSALNQDYPATEVVVVDDGSSDGSRDVIRTFGNRIVTVFQENQGQGAAMSAGFRACSGDIVLFLDSDDELLPNAASSIVAIWTPAISKVHFPLANVTETGKLIGSLNPTRSLEEGDLLYQVLKTGYYTTPPTSGNAYSREMLQAVLPMGSDWRVGADGYLIYKAPFFGSIAAISRPLGLYRAHLSSYTFLGTGRSRRGETLFRLLREDLKRRNLLQETSAQFNYPLDPQAVFKTWSHLKLRLALAKIAPSEPVPSEVSVRRLTLQLLSASVVARNMSIPHKCASIVWGLCVAMVPGRFADGLVQAGFASSSRARIATVTLRMAAKR